MGTPPSRKGSMNEANIPTCESENGPSSFKQIQAASGTCSGGIFSTPHTMDNSSPVRVMELSQPFRLHSGIAASAGKRQTANLPGRRRNFSFIAIASKARRLDRLVQLLGGSA